MNLKMQIYNDFMENKVLTLETKMNKKLDESIQAIELADKNIEILKKKVDEEKESNIKVSKALEEQTEVSKTLQNEITELQKQNATLQ